MPPLVQKLHPALRPGQRLMLAGTRRPLFSRQCDWDGGSALHCAAMGTLLNLDNTFGIAIADPNRGLYVAKANLDAAANVTSFTNPGKFTGVVSLLGNRLSQLRE